MRVLIFHLDGKLPNIALMRIAAHHRSIGDEVELRRTGQPGRIFNDLVAMPDKVYASAIFEKSRFIVDRLLDSFPTAIVGGSGVDGKNNALPAYREDMTRSLPEIGITNKLLDYSYYSDFRQSIGFTQRGCRMKCAHCGVWRREGKVTGEGTIADIWRGNLWPRELLLLDNDFFGQAGWRERVREIRDGGFKVSFSQGINARFLTDEACEAIASIDYRDDGMTSRRIYTAWDNRSDERTLFRGLQRLVKHGVKPDNIMVYMLIGFDHSTKSAREFITDDDLHRQRRLREFGCRPYPMPFVRNQELVGFQRWVIGAYDKEQDKNHIPWAALKAAKYQPANVRRNDEENLFGTESE